MNSLNAKVMLKGLFNLVNIFHYVAIIKICLDVGTNIPGRTSAFGGMWKFLTFWDLWFQLTYFTVALINNIVGSESSSKKASSTQKLRDHLFASVAFPIGIFVCLFFWAVHLYDDNLIFPPQVAKFYPWYANHMMHTAPAVSQLVVLMTTCHVYPARKSGLLTIGSVALTYLVWVCVIAYYGGFWVYPFFKVMSTPVRAVFMVVISIMTFPLYVAGEAVNSLIWGAKSGSGSPKKRVGDSPAVPQHRYSTRSRTRAQKTD